MAQQIVRPPFPVSAIAKLSIDNQSSLDMVPSKPTSSVEVSAAVQTAPQAVKARASDGQGGVYELFRFTLRPQTLEAASIYGFDDPSFVLILLVKIADGRKTAKVAFHHGMKIDAKTIEDIMNDPKYTDQAFFSFNKGPDRLIHLKASGEFIKSTDITDEALFTLSEQLPGHIVARKITLSSSINNARSRLSLQPIVTATLDGHLADAARAVPPGGSASGALWETREPLVHPGLGQVMKPEIAGAMFFDYGVAGSALVMALARWEDGRTETRVGTWPTLGLRPNARTVEIVLTDPRFSESVLLNGPGGPFVEVTGRIVPQGDDTWEAMFTLADSPK